MTCWRCAFILRAQQRHDLVDGHAWPKAADKPVELWKRRTLAPSLAKHDLPSLFMTNSTKLPGPMFSASRMRFGRVTWPFKVTVGIVARLR
jgi:hypothetical protein